MPSDALLAWQTERMPRLQHVEADCRHLEVLHVAAILTIPQVRHLRRRLSLPTETIAAERRYPYNANGTATKTSGRSFRERIDGGASHKPPNQGQGQRSRGVDASLFSLVPPLVRCQQGPSGDTLCVGQ